MIKFPLDRAFEGEHPGIEDDESRILMNFPFPPRNAGRLWAMGGPDNDPRPPRHNRPWAQGHYDNDVYVQGGNGDDGDDGDDDGPQAQQIDGQRSDTKTGTNKKGKRPVQQDDDDRYGTRIVEIDDDDQHTTRIFENEEDIPPPNYSIGPPYMAPDTSDINKEVQNYVPSQYLEMITRNGKDNGEGSSSQNRGDRSQRHQDGTKDTPFKAPKHSRDPSDTEDSDDETGEEEEEEVVVPQRRVRGRPRKTLIPHTTATSKMPKKPRKK